MKAGVASENGLVVRDIPQPRPKPNEVLVKVRGREPQSRRSHHRARPAARQPRRGRRGGRHRLGRRGGRDRRRGARRLQARRPRDVLRQRRLCRIRGQRLGPRQSDAGRHELRAGGDLAGRAQHLAQRTRHRRPPQGRRERDDPGRQLRRRADGAADRQAQGRQAGDRHLDQRRAARAAQGVRRRSRDRHPRPGLARRRCSRRPTARASISWSTCCRGRWWRRP